MQLALSLTNVLLQSYYEIHFNYNFTTPYLIFNLINQNIVNSFFRENLFLHNKMLSKYLFMHSQVLNEQHSFVL